MARWLAVAMVITLPVLAAAQNAPRPDADPRIEKIVASVSEERLKELLTKLVSFGTRNTLSDQTSPTSGIGAARNWILEEMRRSSEKLRVNFDTHTILPQGRITREVDLRNVMAILPGRSPRRIYISGHYDSVNIGGQNQSNSAAPGANSRRRSTDAARIQSERRGQRRQRRRQRHGVDDGAGAGVCGERHPVRCDAGVHHLGRRGTGPGRLQRARRGSQEEQRAHRSRLQQRHRRQLDRRQRHSRCRVDQGLCDRPRGFAGPIAGALHQEDGGRRTCRRIAFA